MIDIECLSRGLIAQCSIEALKDRFTKYCYKNYYLKALIRLAIEIDKEHDEYCHWANKKRGKHMKHDHHLQAAKHLEAAAKHHHIAHKHHEAGGHEAAAHHAHIAHGHKLHAMEYHEHATKSHTKNHSAHHPT